MISDTKMTEGKDEGSPVHKRNKYDNLVTPKMKFGDSQKNRPQL